MAVFTKNVTTGSWTNTALWSPTGYPGQNGAADQALWSSTGSGCSVANATLGQIRASSLTVSPIITNVAGQVLTLSPAGSYSGVGIFITHTTSTSFNLSINGAIKLNESQSFSVAAGNTLNVGGVVSSTNTNDVLTKVESGTLTLSGANTWGGSGGGFVASAGLTTASNAGSFGNAANTVTVNSGASVFVSSVTPAQAGIAITGTGGFLYYGALYVNSAWTTAKTVTLSGSNVMMSLGNANGYAAKLTGTITGDLILNCPVSPTNASLSSTTSDFTVGSGKYIKVRGVNVTTGVVVANAALGLGTSGDAVGLGNSANKIYVEATAGIAKVDNNATGKATRDYFFLGQATSGANEAGTTYAIDVSAGSSCNLDFTGTITATAGYYVKSYGGSSNFGGLTFSGKLDGSWNLTATIVSVGNTVLTLNTGLDVSSWTGTTTVRDIVYGVSPSGPLILDTNATATIDSLDSALVVSHSGYSRVSGSAQTFVGTNNLTLTGGAWASAPGTWTVSANTLTLGFNFSGTTGTLTKPGAGTLVLSGNNTSVTAVSWSAGSLTLNSNNSAGSTGSTFTAASTGTLDSTTGATLGQTGANALNANFTWGGSSDLTFGAGNTTLGAARTISFLNGKTAKLTFPGNWTTTTAGSTLSVGGSPVGGSRSRLSLAGTIASLATTGQVTAGYLRAGNATSLGSESVVGSVTWTVSSGAAIELINGITVSAKKNFNGVGTGPNLDGALRSVSGVNKWQGQISITTATGARIQVDAGTFTLDPTGSPAYTGIDAPAGTNTTPITFTALSGAVLNQDRILAAGFSTVTIGNGSGTVVLSKANLHSGAMTCSAGTTKLTNIAAVGAGAGNSVTVTAGATMESAVKAVFPAALTLGSSGSVATFKISV
jgi:autotransporter-associated beta strand protein